MLLNSIPEESLVKGSTELQTNTPPSNGSFLHYSHKKCYYLQSNSAFIRAISVCLPVAGKEITYWKQIIKLTVKLWLIYFPSFPKKQLPLAGDGCYEKQNYTFRVFWKNTYLFLLEWRSNQTLYPLHLLENQVPLSRTWQDFSVLLSPQTLSISSTRQSNNASLPKSYCFTLSPRLINK